MRCAAWMAVAAASVVLVGTFVPTDARASRWEVRQEVREGAKSVRKEKKEAVRELRKCQTRECAQVHRQPSNHDIGNVLLGGVFCRHASLQT